MDTLANIVRKLANDVYKSSNRPKRPENRLFEPRSREINEAGLMAGHGGAEAKRVFAAMMEMARSTSPKLRPHAATDGNRDVSKTQRDS